ncbi:hypothetical protein [Microbacterium sp. A93]|uniref:hypothetical protein n=1 Tax=Microbacterium sp. A93 TaxID=3450716 RepID=UPI003F42C3D8
MAGVAGRNRVISWIAGIFCVGVIVALLWFAAPMAADLFNFLGDTLRGADASTTASALKSSG